MLSFVGWLGLLFVMCRLLLFCIMRMMVIKVYMIVVRLLFILYVHLYSYTVYNLSIWLLMPYLSQVFVVVTLLMLTLKGNYWYYIHFSL